MPLRSARRSALTPAAASPENANMVLGGSAIRTYTGTESIGNERLALTAFFIVFVGHALPLQPTRINLS